MPTNESQLVGLICRRLRKVYPGCWVFKVVGSPYQETGIPDLLVCVEGRLVGIEVKFQRPGESIEGALSRATPGQRVQIMRIRNAGGTAGVVTTVEGALDLIEEARSQGEKDEH